MRFKPFVVVLAIAAVSAPAQAQWRRVELIPELGYTFGGGRSFDAQTINAVAVPGGKFELKNSMAYGVTLAIEGYSGNFFELSYMRQDTDLGIKWNTTPPVIIVPNPNKTGGISTNQFLLGFRQELVKEERAPTRPYLGAGLGFNVLDPKFNSVGGVSVDASTNFMLAANGGSVLFYVVGHDKKLIRRLVEFLQQSDFAGVIFTKGPMEGTFGLTQALIQSGDAPDVVMAFRWTDLQNQFGVTGEIDADWQRAAGKGTHATLSRFDMHNTLIAAGPDFKRGQTDDLPTGNVDLVPTILQILGIKVPHQMDGRILSEAVAAPTSLLPAPKPEAKSIEARKDFPSGTWRQTLKISRVGSTIYLDEGNGAFVANEPATNESQRNR